MNVTKLLAVAICSVGLTYLSFAQAEKEAPSTPTPAGLIKQLTAIKDMLSLSNETETATIKRVSSTRHIYGLNETEKLINSQKYDDALRTFANALDTPSSSQSGELYVAIKKFKGDISSLIAKNEETLLAEVKKIEEESVNLFPAAKTPEEIFQFQKKVEEYRMRLQRLSHSPGGQVHSEVYSKFSTLASLSTEWARVLTAVQSGDISKAASALQNFKSSSEQSIIMNSSAMQKRITEIEGMQDSIITAAIAKLKDACIKAETADELDKAIEAFNVVYMKNQSGMYNNSNRSLQSKMERMQQAAKQWVRVVVAIEKENYQEAVQMVTSMENDNYGSTVLFSRKELSEKKAELFKKSLKAPKKETDPLLVMINDMMGKVTSIEGLAAVKQLIQNVSRSGYSQNDIQYLVNDITSLETANEAVKNGQYGTVFQSYAYRSSDGYQHKWKPILDKFRANVRYAAIGGLCEIKDFEVGKDETPEKVLQGFIDKAASKKQWEQVLKYLDAYRLAFASSGYGYATWLTDETAAARNFITARNYEKAEEYERAVLNYLAVLNSTSKRTPIDEAIEAIKKIKKNHPDAYEKASRLGVPPATPTNPMPDGSRMLRPGM